MKYKKYFSELFTDYHLVKKKKKGKIVDRSFKKAKLMSLCNFHELESMGVKQINN